MRNGQENAAANSIKEGRLWGSFKKIAKWTIKRMAPALVREVQRLRHIEQLNQQIIYRLNSTELLVSRIEHLISMGDQIGQEVGRLSSTVEQFNQEISQRLSAQLISTKDQIGQEITRQSSTVAQLSQEISERLNAHDFRFDHLKEMIKEVEPYQPTYGIIGVLEQAPQRTSEDRCRTVEAYFGKVAGKHILDIGSSLGYMCYFFADRGAITEGWEYNPKNAEVSRLIGNINGIPTTIKTKAFDKNSIDTIERGKFDVVTIFSVLHHIIHYHGLEYTQRLMQTLLDKVPVLIVELARKGEDPALFWDETQPEDELAIFELIKDKITIEKIGDFPTHLSSKRRPLYVIKSKDNTITVNNRPFIYLSKTFEAYKDSPVVYIKTRRYYFSEEYVIKEYVFDERDREGENKRQIIAEIDTLLHLTNIHNMPELIDFELTSCGAKVVLKKISGRLLVDLLKEKDKINTMFVVQELLRSLADLEKEGLRHNDLRTWNVLYDKEQVSLIDYGFVSHKELGNDAISLLWLLNAVLTGEREGYDVNKKELPKKKAFE